MVSNVILAAAQDLTAQMSFTCNYTSSSGGGLRFIMIAGWLEGLKEVDKISKNIL